METYSDEEMKSLEEHIRTHFGRFGKVLHETDPQDMRVDIYVIEPTEERPHYTLVTAGMGASRMTVPKGNHGKADRAEILVTLPPDWDIASSDERWCWPEQWLRILARVPDKHDTWLSWGVTVSNRGPLADNTELSGIMLTMPYPFGEEAAVCVMPDGSEINFYQMLPLYSSEMHYKWKNGAEELENLFSDGYDMVVDIDRPNVAGGKDLFIRPSDMRNLFHWDDPEGCTAADSIAVDGRRVGYCYRERPAEDDRYWDSGWRFAAGSECIGDPSKSGTYDLNTVCNIDPEIIPLLRAPYGSAFARDGEGAFRPADRPGSDGDRQPGLLSKSDIARLESFDDGGDGGYFYMMLSYLEEFIDAGISEGRFTMRDAREDAEIAMWYSYACNNIDEYEYFCKAVQWMPPSEKNARGCGAWYYRYSDALMYCGRLEQALEYAEAGILQEPDYPWIWLLAGKLRSHFGDKKGALDAVKHGLALKPGDYEFLTLKKEISKGCSLEEMNYHYIRQRDDQQLQDGSDEDADSRWLAVMGILCDPKGLENVKAVFPDGDWDTDGFCCSLSYPVAGNDLELMFRMNEAGLSKMNPDWLKEQKDKLDGGTWLVYEDEDGKEYPLAAVLFYLDRAVTFLYSDNDTGEYHTIHIRKDGTVESSFDEEDGSECGEECSYDPERMSEPVKERFDEKLYLTDMYGDEYYPAFLVDKVRDLIAGVAEYLASGPHSYGEIQDRFDAMTEAINDLEEEFSENGSEIETIARESIGQTVTDILEHFRIEMDAEDAIRQRDW